MTAGTRPIVLVICGPTASGKSSTAIQVALQLNGEIVSADSMQIYRGMDIGTAKVTPEEQALVRHHLIDCCGPDETFSVARFKDLATEAVRDIQSRGKLAIICGGTGQYISALTQGIDYVEIPADPMLRETLNQRAREEGLESLYQELSQVDPESALTIKSQDQKRIVRALEIYHQTGRPKSEHLAESMRKGPDFNFIIFCLTHQREVLYDKINQRVQAMVDLGLVEEVKQLLAETDGSATSTAWQAIGYKEIIACLQGLKTLQEAISDIAQATRRYAKRQLTWFRRMPNVHWLHDLTPEQAARAILEEMKNQTLF